MNKFPELVPNTVIQTTGGVLFIVTWAPSDGNITAYRLVLDKEHKYVVLDGQYWTPPAKVDRVLVRRVYGSENIHSGIREPLRASVIKAILTSDTTQWLLWDSEKDSESSEKSLAKTQELPKIETGMVLRMDTGYFLVVSVDGADLTAYRITRGKDPEFSIGFDSITFFRLPRDAERILSIYRARHGDFFGVHDLHHIYAQNALRDQWCIYDNDPALDVTMAEVYERFGRKVRIIKED